ncbi:pyridoxamine 5'-phosphate oxidase family protein [Streptomyces palmae]|uniref:Pyridoxamine 5'-phosphate oxidase family protein n=1 Tax=Streptomyces palmae TaxID=1701085 RepID=A0A4Z0GZB6_9ACTN|nr:pyridoxamine 5'-phosphate oxidase family protein [Streptomyces palmae]TGB02113.1 pyridoxamine 5'-phosphate oxidase family protein [Streptomyces palmae]
MTTIRNAWSDFQAAEPDLARTVEERFGAFRHHVLATLRRDGSPRLSGLEAEFREGELWLGMMHHSRKALDLRRDPRFALHANPGPGQEMNGGDVRIDGRAVEVTDPAVLARYAEDSGQPGPLHLFRAEIREVMRIRVEGNALVIQSWAPGRGLRTMSPGSGDAPPPKDV